MAKSLPRKVKVGFTFAKNISVTFLDVIASPSTYILQEAKVTDALITHQQYEQQA